MKVSGFMARQYANPHGLFGRLVVSRLLERSNRQANDAIFEVMELDAKSRLLEVGFGSGVLLLRALSLGVEQVVGLERSRDMIGLLRDRASQKNHHGQLELLEGDIEALPWQQARFDRVCSVNTVYFWNDLDRAAGELARVTEAGGLLVLGFSDGEALRERGYEQRGFRLHQPQAVRRAMIDAGFTVAAERELRRGAAGPYQVVSLLRTA